MYQEYLNSFLYFDLTFILNGIFVNSMGNATIRKIKKSDNVAIANVIRAIFIEFDAPKKGTVYSDPTTDHLFELFQEPKSCLYVLEENGEILGCCGIYPTSGLSEDCTEIVKFYIANKGRGKGYGKALFFKCEQAAIQLGYKQLYIESIPDFSTAIGMYKKLGFQSLSAPLGESGHFGCDIWLLKDI